MPNIYVYMSRCKTKLGGGRWTPWSDWEFNAWPFGAFTVEHVNEGFVETSEEFYEDSNDAHTKTEYKWIKYSPNVIESKNKRAKAKSTKVKRSTK